MLFIPPQKPCAACGGAGQTLPETAEWRPVSIEFQFAVVAI